MHHESCEDPNLIMGHFSVDICRRKEVKRTLAMHSQLSLQTTSSIFSTVNKTTSLYALKTEHKRFYFYSLLNKFFVYSPFLRKFYYRSFFLRSEALVLLCAIAASINYTLEKSITCPCVIIVYHIHELTRR